MTRDEHGSTVAPDAAVDERIAGGPLHAPARGAMADRMPLVTRLTRRPGLDPPVLALYTSGRANLLGAAWLAR